MLYLNNVGKLVKMYSFITDKNSWNVCDHYDKYLNNGFFFLSVHNISFHPHIMIVRDRKTVNF